MSASAERLSPVSDYPHTFMLEHAWRGIATGQFQPMSEQEVASLVASVWAEPPLVSISPADDTSLRGYYTSYMLIRANRDVYRQLSEPVTLIGEEPPQSVLEEFKRTFWGFPTVLLDEHSQRATSLGYPAMTPAEKIALLSNPNTYNNIRVLRNNSSELGFTGYGIRPFIKTRKDLDDSYGYTLSRFQQIASQTANRIGTKTLPILDIGGGNGLGMYDLVSRQHQGQFGAYEFLPTIVTAEEELAMWPAGRFIIRPAERLPYNLKETFALIVSNRAFEYFCYSEVALKNAIAALMPGGWMRVMFDFHDSPLLSIDQRHEFKYLFPSIEYSGPHLYDRIRAGYQWLRRMEQEGYVDIQTFDDGQWGPGIPNCGPIELIKRKSIPDSEFAAE